MRPVGLELRPRGDFESVAPEALRTSLVRENQTLAVEDLNVSGMLRNRKLARCLVDVAFSEFRR